MWEDGRGAPRAGLEWHKGPQEAGYSVASLHMPMTGTMFGSPSPGVEVG